jgi:hypothetical protein
MTGVGGSGEIVGGSREGSGVMSFYDLEDRLVEALRICWRDNDRERGWQHVKSAWPEIMREDDRGDYDARGGDATSSDVTIRPASLTRQDVADMEQAFGWLDAVDPTDRRLIGFAINELARGKREISWVKLLRPMGLPRGSEGLRMRYGRAMTSICKAVNGRNPSADVSIR